MSSTLKNPVPLPQLDKLRPQMVKNNRKALYKIGVDHRRSANRSILTGEKTGRLYILRTRSGRRRRHRSSAPGETHANLSGALRKSIGWKVKGHTRLYFGYGVTGSAPIYARAIEFGNSKIKPRPSLKNAINAQRRNTIKHITAAMKKSFNL